MITRIPNSMHCDNPDFDKHLELNLESKLSYHSRDLIGFYNGILCFVYDSIEPVVLLWNPSARKSLNLFVPHCVLDSNNGQAYEFYIHGFGFDAVTSDYKVVVCVCALPETLGRREGRVSRIRKVYIYTVIAGTWSSVDASIELIGGQIRMSEPVAHANGMKYWLVDRGKIFDDDDEVDGPLFSILMFNLAIEKFSEIAFPQEVFDGVTGRWGVQLRAISWRQGEEVVAIVVSSEATLDVWVLEEYNNLDTKFKSSWKRVICGQGNMRFVNVRSNGEIIVKLDSDPGMMSLNCQDGTTKLICDRLMQCMGHYVENLQPLSKIKMCAPLKKRRA